MADSAETSWSKELKEPLELVLKVVTLLIVLGVAVVHLRLAKVSYFSTNVSRALYIAASFWLLLPLVAAWMFLSRAAMPYLARQIMAKGTRARIGWLTYTVGFLVVFAVSLAVIFAPDARYLSRQTWPGRLIVLALLGCLVVMIPMGITHDLKVDHGLQSARAALRDTPLAAMLVYGLVYVSVFEQYAYTAIPGELGGGRPLVVRIVATDSAANVALRAAGLSFTGGISAPVDLLMTTSATYLVQANPTSKAVEIPTGLVNAMIYEGRE